MPSLVDSVPPPDQVPASGDSGEAACAAPERPSAMTSTPAVAKWDFDMMDLHFDVDAVTTRQPGPRFFHVSTSSAWRGRLSHRSFPDLAEMGEGKPRLPAGRQLLWRV